LATNALVEGQGGRAALIAIGMEENDLTRSGLSEALKDTPVVRINGGHNGAGGQAMPLDMDALTEAVKNLKTDVDGFAVAGHFATRNPAHEKQVKQYLMQETNLPVTCSHELSAKLGAPQRALTCLLNARLIGMIDRLIRACEGMLDSRDIKAPLMVVRGDGALISAEMARERPIETILSGPAASIVGASWLTGEAEAMVSDIGGTTTDVAVLRDGRPSIDPKGAMVGGWRTMVEAVAMRTEGLGGDSEVSLAESGLKAKINLGPRRVVPVSLFAQRFPGIAREALDRQLGNQTPGEHDARFAFLNAPDAPIPTGLTDREVDVFELLQEGPRPLDRLLKSRLHGSALKKLAARGVAAISGITPSDACHVLGIHDGWDSVAAKDAMTLYCRKRAGNGDVIAASEKELAQMIYNRVTERTAEVILRVGFEEDGFEVKDLENHVLTMAGLNPDQKGLVKLSTTVGVPVIGLGASAHVYYGDAAKILRAPAIIPDDAGVANAIGAVVGQVRVTETVTISSPSEGLFRVHSALGAEDFANLDKAISKVTNDLDVRLTEQAELAGASAIRVNIMRDDKTVDVDGHVTFIESKLVGEATGRPRVAV